MSTLKRVGLALADPRHPFWAILGQAVQRRCREAQLELITYTATTVTAQAMIIERLIQQQVDVLLVVPIASVGLGPAVDQARQAGIAVIVLDMALFDTNVTCTICSNNVQGGWLAARALARQFDHESQVVLLAGPADTQTSVARAEGFRHALHQFSHLKLVMDVDCALSREAGAAMAEQALVACGPFDALFATNDVIALGAVEWLAHHTKPIPLVVGFDALSEALTLVRHKQMFATVRQQPEQMAQLAVTAVEQILRGKAQLPNKYIPVKLITQHNVTQAAFDLVAMLPQLLHDLTERSQELDAERHLLRSMIDAIPDAIYVKDRDSRFLIANTATARQLGVADVADLRGTLQPDHGPNTTADQDTFSEQVIMEQGAIVINHEQVSTHATERGLRDILATKVPLRNPRGEVIGLIGVERDITEHKRLQAQLLHAQKMEIIGRLSGGIAHDFNNLLTAIIGYTDLITLDLPEDHNSIDDIAEIRRAATRGANLTRQLLAFARQQPLTPRCIRINQLIVDVARLLRRLLGPDIDMTLDLYAADPTIMADAGQIEQVLINMALNARDAMPEGGILTISTSILEVPHELQIQQARIPIGTYLVIGVHDTGVGMEPEVQAQVFEPFFTTKEAGKGTGLGLAMCYGIIKQHRGYIWVESQLHQGTMFRIFLPVSDCQPERV